MGQYDLLFSPLTVRRMTLKNRIVMTPMGTNYAQQSGEISDLHIHYYEQRAKGGTGMIIVENANIDFPMGANGTTQLRIDHDNFIPKLYVLTETVHKYGTKIALQINHAGAATMAARIGAQPASASNIPTKAGAEVPRPLTKEEILDIVKKFGQAAKRAKIAGFDAVEVHAGHSYLLSQFFSPLTNDRTDEFGGSPENRARFAKMVMEEVRKNVGPDFPISMRISVDELNEGGNRPADTLELLEYCQDEADIIDVSVGLANTMQYQVDVPHLPDGWRAYLAKPVREKFGKPTIVTGNIRDPKVAEDIVKRGDSDLIGMGRGLIAEPQWVNKVQQGREGTLRKCISCNIGCAGNRMGANRPIRCTVNPTIHSGEDYAKCRVKTPCNVVVIGGGTAGLEAACTAAEVGCTTFLIEKNTRLGGLAAEIAKIPDKARMADFPSYLLQRAEALNNLFIFTDKEADADFVKTLHPDIIVNATGSTPLLPPIKGLAEALAKPDTKVATALTMIQQLDNYPQDLSGKKVVVIGGGAVGMDMVEFFAPRNAEVTVVEMLSDFGRDLNPILKSLVGEILQKYQVKQMAETKLIEVRDDGFTVQTGKETVDLPFDYGFVCLGMKPNQPLLDNLRAAFPQDAVEIYNIGDSSAARRIIEGVQEGHDILDVLTRRGYL